MHTLFQTENGSEACNIKLLSHFVTIFAKTQDIVAERIFMGKNNTRYYILCCKKIEIV